MSRWPSEKATKVLAALIRAGWSIKRQCGSHLVLSKLGCSDYVWAFHHGDEIGPRMMARVARDTGLAPEDL